MYFELFVQVTVCPHKNSLLNLNYNIIKSEEVALDNKMRKELLEYALGKTSKKRVKRVTLSLKVGWVWDPKPYFS